MEDQPLAVDVFFSRELYKVCQSKYGATKPKETPIEQHGAPFLQKKIVHLFYYGKNHGLGVLSTTSFRIVFFQMPSFCSNFLKNPKPPPLQGLEIDDITQSKTTSGVKFHGVHGQTYRVLTHPHTKLRGEDEAKVALDDLAQLVEAGLVF